MSTRPRTYYERAQEHRPTDIEQLRAEVIRLRATGLTARDIASSLHLDLAAVITWLAERQP